MYFTMTLAPSFEQNGLNEVNQINNKQRLMQPCKTHVLLLLVKQIC